ncbi:MAG: hypothetical protein ACE5HE_11195 [Phycisphaerae bacterium]
MDESPPYHLDIEGLETTRDPGCRGGGLRNRPWVGIRFACCSVYARVYRNREGTAYRGRCPRCNRWVTLQVGPDGTDARFFIAE